MKHLITLFTLLLPASLLAETAPSFRQDVMPVLFRAGCNAGTCHGSAKGKDGFMLSLFGYDPAGDYQRIVNDIAGRRVNLAVPERSLLLLKAIGKVPHTGGDLFAADSTYYKILHDWIAAGAPDDAQDVPDTTGLELAEERFVFEGKTTHAQLRVLAQQSDGSKRDVTNLARYHSNNSTLAAIDENGRISAGGGLFGTHRLRSRFARFVARRTRFEADREVLRILVGHGDRPEEGQRLADELAAALPADSVEFCAVTDMGPAIGVHGGPGTLVVAIHRKLRD